MHAAIDVDFRGDREDYERRCRHVERVLLSLGIPANRMLICPSPSGGRHYRIFFKKPVFTCQLPIVFEIVSSGLTGGQFRGATGPRRATNGRGQWCYLDIFSTLT